jgi:hypothetical protein
MAVESTIGMNNQNGDKGGLLASWKEIAEYLGYEVRTCRSIESIRNHRAPGFLPTKKSWTITGINVPDSDRGRRDVIFYSRKLMNPHLAVSSIQLSDMFRRKFRDYQNVGKIPAGELNETPFTKDLAKQILYFDGRGWTAKPAFK